MSKGSRIGQSALLSYALYIGIGFSAIYIVVSTGGPYIQNMQDTAAIQQHMQDIQNLEEAVQTVAQRGTGTQVTTSIHLDRGELIIENESIVYRLETGSSIITAGTTRQLNDIRLSSNAQTSLTLTTYNGTECYRLANQHVEACIKKYGTNTSFQQASLEDTILYLENTRVNQTLHPDLSLTIDSNTTIDTGRISTRPIQTGQHLGTGQLAILIKPTNKPTYTLRIKLRSGSDFLQVSVR